MLSIAATYKELIQWSAIVLHSFFECVKLYVKSRYSPHYLSEFFVTIRMPTEFLGILNLEGFIFVTIVVYRFIRLLPVLLIMLQPVSVIYRQ